MAILNWFGCPYIVRKKYRVETWRKDFQRNVALPDSIVGVGLIFLGLKYPNFYEQNTSQFCIGLIASSAIALVLILRVRNKYDL